jgi:CHASE2 domain-containing sensor protein
VSSRKKQRSEPSPSRLLLWVAIAGLIFGLIGFGELPEDVLRAGRNSLHTHSASGDIVIVKVDDASLREIGRWPWPRRYDAQLTDRLAKAGVRRIFFDVMFENASDPVDDRLFADAIRRAGRVTLPARARSGLVRGAAMDSVPLGMFGNNAELGSISARYNYQNAVWKLQYGTRIGGKLIPSYAAKLANVQPAAGQDFLLDYSIDPKTIPSISAAAVLNGTVSGKQLAGKDVMIGVTSDAVGDQYFIPGGGKMGGS